MPSTTYDPRTLSVHAGLVPDAITGAIAPNICTTSNFVFNPGMTFSANLNPDMTSLPYVYSRWTNPTVRQLELRLAALEGADDGVCTASGMAAITTLFFGVLKSGDHIIVSDVCYPGVRELLTDIMSDYGVTNTAVNLSVIEEVQAALRPNTRLIHAESPCNPLLRLTDIAALAVVAKTANALFSVDSTVATPVATNPIALGADFVIHRYVS